MPSILRQTAALVAAALLSLPALAGQPVNVNAANAESIAEALDGIGLSKARAIVAYRDANGPFKHVDELVNVKGIGLSTVDKNRTNIRLEKEGASGNRTR